MKICLYLENAFGLKESGIGSAIKHQSKALDANKVKYTLNPKDDYDILHVNFYGLASAKEVFKAKRKGKKVIIHTHTTAEDLKRSFIGSSIVAFFLKYWLKWYYSKADLLIAPSSYTKSLLVTKYKLNESKIAVISNGVDSKRLKYDAKKAKDFKEKFKLKTPVVFAVGYVFVRKGIVDFIKISRKFKSTFMWVGKYMKGVVDNKELKKELDNKPENFIMTGFVEDIIGAYSAGDIFFFPSYEENEGIVVLEAAAMKKAIIVRDIPVFRSYLTQGENALFAKTNKEFEEQIKYLANHPEIREKLGENARKLAEKLSLENVGKKLKETYESLLKKN